MNRKNIASIIGFLVIFGMALTPTILLVNQKPNKETIIEKYYYNETI